MIRDFTENHRVLFDLICIKLCPASYPSELTINAKDTASEVALGVTPKYIQEKEICRFMS